MPIIKHSSRALVGNNDRIGVREIVDKKDGAAYLKLTEVIMDPGSEYKLHTHPTEQVVTVLGGSIQMVLDGEVQTLRRGYTFLAPAGVTHALVNNTWVSARMLIIDAAQDVETSFI